MIRTAHHIHFQLLKAFPAHRILTHFLRNCFSFHTSDNSHDIFFNFYIFILFLRLVNVTQVPCSEPEQFLCFQRLFLSFSPFFGLFWLFHMRNRLSRIFIMYDLYISLPFNNRRRHLKQPALFLGNLLLLYIV